MDLQLQIVFWDFAIGVSIKLTENSIKDIISTELLKLKLFSPSVDNLAKACSVQRLSDDCFRWVRLFVDNLDKYCLCASSYHLLYERGLSPVVLSLNALNRWVLWSYHCLLSQLYLLKKTKHTAKLYQHNLANDCDLLFFEFFHGLIDLDDTNTICTRQVPDDRLSLVEGTVIFWFSINRSWWSTFLWWLRCVWLLYSLDFV